VLRANAARKGDGGILRLHRNVLAPLLVGNRTSHTWDGLVDSYATAGTSNRLVGIDGPRAKTFMHNANGNITSVAGTTYTYDVFNRLSQASRDGVDTNYWVNALGQRTYKDQTPPNARGFMYGLDGQLVVEYDWNSLSATHFLRLGSEPIAMVRGNQLYYLHNDHLGRPEIATNSGKAVVWRASNYAFDRKVTLDSIGGLNLGFPGQYYDAETGNWHNGHRDYDKSIGRYLQTDAIGLAGGLNTYAYASANPIGRIDPTGLIDCTCGGSKDNYIGGKAIGPLTSDQATDVSLQRLQDRNTAINGVATAVGVAASRAIGRSMGQQITAGVASFLLSEKIGDMLQPRTVREGETHATLLYDHGAHVQAVFVELGLDGKIINLEAHEKCDGL